MKDQNNTRKSGGATAVKPRKKSGLKALTRKFSFKYGTTTLVLVAIILALIIGLNVFLGMFQERYPVDIDLTREKIYTMSDTAREYAESINEEVHFYVLNNELDFGSVYVQPLAIIKQFVQANDKFKLEFIDSQVDNTFATNYPNDTLVEDYLIVQKGDRYKIINDDTFIDVEEDDTTGVTTKTSQIEDRIISALYNVLDDTTYTVGFTTGHEEAETTVLRENITENNFAVSDVSLDETGWSDGVNILMIYAPLKDFSVENVKQLDNFMNNNGKQDRYIAYFASAEQPNLPNLESFLSDWGIEVTDNIIKENDSSRYYLNDKTYIYGEVSASESRYGYDYIDFTAGSDYQILMPVCRELKAVYESRDGITTRGVVLANGDAEVVPVSNPNGEGVAGEYNAIMAADRAVDDTVSRLIVFGSSTMVTDDIMNFGGTVVNQKFITKMLNSWTDKVSTEVIVQPVDMSDVTISLTTQTANIWLTIFVILLPAAILVAGMIVFIKRRYQ